MTLPIDRTTKDALDGNLVNGITSDAPKVKSNNDNLYNTIDELNTKVDNHANSSVLPHPDSSVTTAKIANSAVTTPKIADLNVTTPKIADGAITSVKIDPAIVSQVGIDAHRLNAVIDHPDGSVTDVKLSDAPTDIKERFAAHESKTMSKVVLVTEPYDQVTTTTINLGFKPKSVQILADIEATKYESIGYSDGSSSYCRFKQTSDETYGTIINPINLRYNITNSLSGTVAFTDTGLTITWSLTGTLTGASGNRRLVISAITH